LTLSIQEAQVLRTLTLRRDTLDKSFFEKRTRAGKELGEGLNSRGMVTFNFDRARGVERNEMIQRSSRTP